MLCTAEIDMAEQVTPNDVDVFLDNVAWAIRFTIYTVLRASPDAFIFGEGMLDIPFVADWHKTVEHRQSLTGHSNQHKNTMITMLEIKYSLKKKVYSAKQSPSTPKNHGISQQFI
jgi:hypothetical protein